MSVWLTRDDIWPHRVMRREVRPTPSGRQWRLTCPCGFRASATSEAEARGAMQAHCAYRLAQEPRKERA